MSRTSIPSATRNGAEKVWRAATARWRVLPDFVIIGAARCGTTSLYEYLVRHPDVEPAYRKEVHYVDVNFGRGEWWYRAMFPSRLRVRTLGRRRGGLVRTGEASPYYLFHPRAPSRLRAVVPNAKLVVLLRDPAVRAISHYRHSLRQGFETLSLVDALAAEPTRLKGEAERLQRGDDSTISYAYQHYSYVARGFYSEQLRAWFAHFPRKQILVLSSEELFANPAAEYAKVLHFLGLRPTPGTTFQRFNAGTGGLADPEVEAKLRDAFRDANRDLAALLGRDFEW